MKKRVLAGLLIASALLWMTLPLPQTRKTPVEPEREIVHKPAPTNRPASFDDLWVPLHHEAPTGTSLTERALLAIDPAWVEKYQGSHTLDELRDGDRSSSLNLNSSWIIPDSGLPRIGVTFRKEPGGDTYKVRGGEVAFPDSGVGVRYETEETGESRTFLQVQKEF